MNYLARLEDTMTVEGRLLQSRSITYEKNDTI